MSNANKVKGPGIPAAYLENKNCNGCKIVKYFTDYRKVRPLKNGPRKGQLVGWKDKDGNTRFSRCKDCERKRIIRDYRKRPYIQIYSAIKIRAKRKNIPFKISQEYLKNLLLNAPKKCPALGIKMTISAAHPNASRIKSDSSPSVDRIIPEKGYVEGNLVVVSDLANKIKTDATPDQIRKVADYYKKLMDSKKYIN